MGAQGEHVSPPEDHLWYKDAIIYAVNVQTFQDSDGDGIGDFAGLTSRLDYLADLGVDCLWLLPFYPSPNRDNGYDVADYLGVDPRLGSLDDFAAFKRAAAERGIRLLLDLVIHHTSDQHPWFQATRADPASPYRDYYIWAESPPAQTSAKVIFPGVEESVWRYDEEVGAYYLHQFYGFEPDLNVEHPALADEARRIMAWWIDRGADGFRVDAASHLLGAQALLPRPTTQPQAFLRVLRCALDEHLPGGALIGEADVAPAELATYFREGRLHLVFNFFLDNFLFLAFARGEAEPIARGLRRLPPIPAEAQWGTFLRNLDELDLEQLEAEEREEVYRAFAPEERMRAYGRGIRRRLAPMLGGDPRRLRLAFSLLLTLPGAPVLAYGDEIGMGEDLALPERESVRTVMQWSAAPNGGFSTAPAAALTQPIIADGPFGYERVNVAVQSEDPASLLNWLRRAVAARKRHPELGRGSWRIVPTNDPRVIALCASWRGRETIAVHNLSAVPCTVALDFGMRQGAPPRDDFADQLYPPPHDNRVELGSYGYRWLGADNVR
jgi:maltose alpha-D-glucosyltransferase / alpha-amylase